jgi:hypothetical protein
MFGSMGFSVKLAPGVRIRASSRGLRTSVGPRAARVHFGAGRTGFSSGAGPVGFYTSVGGGSARRPSTGASSRALASAAKAEQAQELAAALTAIFDLHRPEFPLAERPIAPPAPTLNEQEVTARYRKSALAGISVFARAARAQAKVDAGRAARTEVAAWYENNARLREQHQAELDEWWKAVLANDPGAVLGALAEAFEGNEAAAAPVGVEGGEASIAVLVPSPSALPERRPTTTAAGNLSLKKLTKRELADFYKLMVCGYVVATVKEAFAVAPALQHVRVVALRNGGTDAYGVPRVETILAARFARAALQGVAWATVDATTVLNDTNDELRANFRGPNKEFAALDLAGEPDLAALVAAVDVAELTG